MKTMLTVAALFAASIATPALAQDVSSQSGFSVRYADLDLTRDADVRTLDRRIHNAATAACGTPSSADPQGREKVKACRAEAKAAAYAQRSKAIAFARQPSSTSLAAAR
jgi:UrcA family protein